MSYKCRLNNLSMRNLRKEHVYQALMIDLYLAKVISKDTCEKFLDGNIPENIQLPDSFNETTVITQLLEGDKYDEGTSE